MVNTLRALRANYKSWMEEGSKSLSNLFSPKIRKIHSYKLCQVKRFRLHFSLADTLKEKKTLVLHPVVRISKSIFFYKWHFGLLVRKQLTTLLKQNDVSQFAWNELMGPQECSWVDLSC